MKMCLAVSNDCVVLQMFSGNSQVFAMAGKGDIDNFLREKVK